MTDLAVSIVIPVKNDAGNLSECLPLLKEFDDVKIVDSGSADDTAELAKMYGRELVQFSWDGKFPKKRNWALANCTFKHEWVMFLDADERMTEAFKTELRRVLPSTKCNGFVCFYDNWFMGRMLRHGDVMRKSAILRLGHGGYERIEERNWSKLDMEIHEHLVVDGVMGVIKARLEHHDKRSVESYRRKHEEYAKWEANRCRMISDYSKLTARQRLKYSLLRSRIFPLLYFLGAYVGKLGFLDGLAGFRFAAGKMHYFSMIGKLLRGEAAGDESAGPR